MCGLRRRVETGEKLYLHCWGGRGRTGLVAACLLTPKPNPSLTPIPNPNPNPNPNPAKAMDWHKLRSMPSGRLFWLLPGDVLVLPAGTRHAAPRMVAMHRPHAT